MAITIMPQQESFGGALGTGLGSGLSSGMDTLINMKLENLKKRQTQQRMKTGLLESGVPEKQANLVSMLAGENPKLAQAVMARGIEALPEMFLGLTEGPIPATQEAAVPQAKKHMPQTEKRKKQLDKLFKAKRRESIQSLKKRLIHKIKKGKATKEETQSMLLRWGFDEKSAEMLLSETLTDAIRLDLLSRNNNDPEKAKKMARRFGFKV